MPSSAYMYSYIELHALQQEPASSVNIGAQTKQSQSHVGFKCDKVR